MVDRIEEGRAALEVDGRELVNLPLWMLPPGVREGDVLRVGIEPDAEEQARRLEQSRAQLARGRTGDGGGTGEGDIVL